MFYVRTFAKPCHPEKKEEMYLTEWFCQGYQNQMLNNILTFISKHPSYYTGTNIHLAIGVYLNLYDVYLK